MASCGVLSSAIYAQGKGRAKVAEGNKLFAEGKFDEANNAYRDAQLDNPTAPEIEYNIANTLYEKSNYEEAIKLFGKITKNTDDPVLQTRAYYNLGNTLYRLNKWPESILAYKEALKIDPNDEDAKYNLEYVRAKLKQNADKQNQGQDQQEQNEQEQQQDQQEEQKKEDEQQNQAGDEKQQQQEQQQQQAEKQEEISKEDAERILKALENQEKEQLQNLKKKGSGRRRSKKDW